MSHEFLTGYNKYSKCCTGHTGRMTLRTQNSYNQINLFKNKKHDPRNADIKTFTSYSMGNISFQNTNKREP